MSFFHFKKKPSLSFVFDIRDTSLTLAAVRFEIDKKPEMVLCQNFEFKSQKPLDHNKYFSTLLKTIDAANISIRKSLVKINNNEGIDSYHFFIGSPWSISQSKTIKVIKDKPFEIDNNLLKKIIVGEENELVKNLGKENSETNWRIIEEKIVQSKLDGYKVNDIFGKKASNFAAELFVSFVPSELKEKILSYVSEKINKRIEKQNNSCILSSYSFFRDLYTDKNDFIYVDIGKLITDIYVVKDDVIFGVASFPFGGEHIIQNSLSKTNLTREIFMSHLNIGYDKKFNLTSHNNGEDLLKTGFDLWEENFISTMSEICTEINIPNNLFIFPNDLIVNMFTKNLIGKINNNKSKIFDSKVEVSVINEGVMNSFVSNGKIFLNEPYIKMDLVFLDKIFKQSNI